MYVPVHTVTVSSGSEPMSELYLYLSVYLGGKPVIGVVL